MAGKVFFSVSMSLDGFIAPGSLGDLMGQQWMELQQWVFPQRFFRENLGLGEGGEEGRDNDIVRETFERTGASVMGKRMFEAGEQMWPEEAPFHTPVFVVTHEKRDPWERPGGTTFHFVNDGIEAALDQAREAAGDRDVRIAGGGATILEYVNAGLIDEFTIALSPVLFGSGIRLFEGVDAGPRGPGAGPRGALPKGDAPDLHRPGAVTVPNSALSGRGQRPADGPVRPGGDDGWRHVLTDGGGELAMVSAEWCVDVALVVIDTDDAPFTGSQLSDPIAGRGPRRRGCRARGPTTRPARPAPARASRSRRR